MTKAINTQSQKRHQESIGSLFHSSKGAFERKVIFLKSSSDEGVVQNGGRNGARLAPQSLLATFKKLNLTESLLRTQMSEVEVANEAEEKKNFSQAQSLESSRIEKVIDEEKDAWICHLGGGHDHIFPLLSAIQKKFKKILVINIDAHADTRTDDEPSSGTPFRQFAESFEGEFFLYQIGLHHFSNSMSTLTDLEKGNMQILWSHQVPTQSESFFERMRPKIDPDTAVVFSLDADALSSSFVPGVSAVNADGLDLKALVNLWKLYRGLNFSHPPVLGIYELNPVYDTLASQSMRSVSAFIYQTLN